MKLHFNLLHILLLIIIQINKFLQHSLEEILRNSTISSFKKIESNIYMLNYQNNYYLRDLLNKGVQNQNEVKLFIGEKFGINFDIKIQKNDKVDSCTSFNVYNNKNQNLFCRNFDYPKLTPALVVWTHPIDGYRSISFVYSGFIGLFEGEEIIKERLLFSIYEIVDGFNEAGLALSILKIKNTTGTHQNDRSKKNVTSTVMIKGALDYCGNVLEAIQFFNKYNMQDISDTYTLHYMITDAQGDSIIIEYVNNVMIVIKPYSIGSLKYSFVTNFFLFKPIGIGNDNGLDRFNILKNTLQYDTIMEMDEAMNLLSKVRKNTTFWSNVYNTKELTVVTALRQQYDVFYEFKIQKPNKYSKKNSLK